jgi:transcriptional antiterminator RfaH
MHVKIGNLVDMGYLWTIVATDDTRGQAMPILEPETNLFPENLLDGFTKDAADRCWWVLYTKARQEKAVARQLLVREIPFYLPLVAKRHLIRGRRVQSLVPVFSGYVFLFGDEWERVGSLKTNRISRILNVDNQDELYRDLRHVSRLIDSDAPLTVERRLQPGRPVRVKTGAMIGAEGVVISRRGQNRLLVAVTFLQQGVSMEIDDFLLEPLN